MFDELTDDESLEKTRSDDEDGSEKTRSEDEESDKDMFVYQSLSQLISQREKDLDVNDGTDWLRAILISEVQEDPDTDTVLEFLPQDNLGKEDGHEVESSNSTTEVNVEMEETDLNPNNDDIVSHNNDIDEDEDEEEYFGDDENGPILKMKHEDLAPQKEENDEDDDEKDFFKSKEIVLNPEYLNFHDNPGPSPPSPGSRIPHNTPRLTRKLSFGNKIFQTLQKRNWPTPGKSTDDSPKANKKSKKENIKIILF